MIDIDVQRWISSTASQLHQSNTYVSMDIEVHHRIRKNFGYKQVAQYRMDDQTLTVHDLPMSNPRCYFLSTGEWSVFVDARSLLPFLVRFGCRLSWCQVRYSFDNCIPEREIEAATYPLWFTPVTVGYQTIWYTTGNLGELYMERLLWTEEGTPIVEDHKFFEHVGYEVRELYE